MRSNKKVGINGYVIIVHIYCIFFLLIAIRIDSEWGIYLLTWEIVTELTIRLECNVLNQDLQGVA